MPETYSRKGSIMIGKESTENTPVIPSVSLPVNSEDISVDYAAIASTPIQASRTKNQRALKKGIPAPVGGIDLNVEPKTFGHILSGLCGGLTSGVLFQLSDVDSLTVGDTIDNGSTGTGTVAAIIPGENIVLATGVSGDWATGNTVDNGGAHSSTLGVFSATVYGHDAVLPQELDITYTVQRNLVDRAIRFCGVKFHGIDSFGQSDNIVTASVKAIARSVFSGAYVKAAVTSGSGSKTILLDQTQGLVATDSIKVWRAGTGFLDFASSGVKTHAIASISAGVSITVTNLQTALQEGDILVLAPLTPSYSVVDEFVWIGGSQVRIGATRLTLADADVQDFSMTIVNEMEEKHAASGTGFADRFPIATLQKEFMGSGSFTLYNQDEQFQSILRRNTDRAIQLKTSAGQIGSTGIDYELRVLYTNAQYGANDLLLSADDIVNEEVSFEAYDDVTAGHAMRVLLINDVASY